jgi:chemotaxis methyl-accepting protein methylase
VSVAALVAEAGLLERCELLGSDCRRAAVSAAASCVVDGAAWPTAFGGLRERFFEPAPAGWRLRPALAARLSWKQADVTASAEAGPWHLVLFRNVSIYLTAAAAERAATRLAGELAPGGWLVLGSAERPPATLGLVPLQRGLYRRPQEDH